MMTSFWDKLPKPFFALAPMAEVTDAAFRRIIAKYSRPAGPAVFWTEFVSADGLCHSKGRKKLLVDLLYSEDERPIVAQLFTARPAKMTEAARLIRGLGFDGLDINMGCPDRKVEKQGAGAALIKNPKLARELIRAARAGATPLPISVKTRIGYRRDELDFWLPELLAEAPAAITIHARTRAEMSKAPARWESVARAVAIRNELKSQTLIIGNGDVIDLQEAATKARATGADGIMFGRAILGNPWLFARPEFSRSDLGASLRSDLRIIKEKLSVLIEHAKLFEELLGKTKSFAVMKKHFKAYAAGWDGANELRKKLMGASNGVTVEKIVDKYLATML